MLYKRGRRIICYLFYFCLNYDKVFSINGVLRTYGKFLENLTVITEEGRDDSTHRTAHKPASDSNKWTYQEHIRRAEIMKSQYEEYEPVREKNYNLIFGCEIDGRERRRPKVWNRNRVMKSWLHVRELAGKDIPDSAKDCRWPFCRFL